MINPFDFNFKDNSNDKLYDDSLYQSSKLFGDSVKDMKILNDTFMTKFDLLPPLDWILNTGGPVTCIEWCPFDHPDQQSWMLEQYLAIASQKWIGSI